MVCVDAKGNLMSDAPLGVTVGKTYWMLDISTGVYGEIVHFDDDNGIRSWYERRRFVPLNGDAVAEEEVPYEG